MNIASTPVSGLCEFEKNDKTIHDELEVTDDFLSTTSSDNAFVSEKFDVDVVQDADLLISITRTMTGGKQPRKRHHPLQAPHKQPRRNVVPAQQLNAIPNIDCQSASSFNCKLKI